MNTISSLEHHSSPIPIHNTGSGRQQQIILFCSHPPNTADILLLYDTELRVLYSNLCVLFLRLLLLLFSLCIPLCRLLFIIILLLMLKLELILLFVFLSMLVSLTIFFACEKTCYSFIYLSTTVTKTVLAEHNRASS